MDIPALSGSSGPAAKLDGKIESVQDGVAKVRLSSGSMLDVPVDREFPSGTPVSVGVGTDGTLKLSLRGGDPDVAALRARIETALLSLVGKSLAEQIAVPLAKGDLAAAAKLLPSTTPSANTGSSAASNAPAGPAFLSAPTPVSPPSGQTWLMILSQLDENLYAAESAGKSWTLHGPSDVQASTRLLASASPVPGGSSLWLPSQGQDGFTGVETLPAKIQAGSEGAAELLRWAGVPDATPQEIDDLGAALARTAQVLLERADPEMEPAVADAANPSAKAYGTPGGIDPRVVPVPSFDPEKPTIEIQTANARRATPEPNPPRASDSLPPPVLTEIVNESLPAPEPASSHAPSRTAPPAADVPAAGASQGRIASGTAVRVLASWAAGLPDTEPVKRAVVGGAPSLPDALAELFQAIKDAPGRHPALEAALADVRQFARIPSPSADPGIRRALEAAVLESLHQESRSPQGDPAPFRRAAEALLADRLPDSTPNQTASQSFWSGAPEDLRKARIVVRDERKSKGSGKSAESLHAVDITMAPPGMGEVGARLELRGRVLTTRLEASDPATADLLRSRLQELSAAFSALGLEQGGLDVREKASTPASKETRRQGAGGSLDVRA